MDFTTKMISIALFAYAMGMATVLFAIAWVKMDKANHELREEYVREHRAQAVKENHDNNP